MSQSKNVIWPLTQGYLVTFKVTYTICSYFLSGAYLFYRESLHLYFTERLLWPYNERKAFNIPFTLKYSYTVYVYSYLSYFKEWLNKAQKKCNFVLKCGNYMLVFFLQYRRFYIPNVSTKKVLFKKNNGVIFI